MDLTLNLGESPARPVEEIAVAGGEGDRLSMGMKHGFCMGLDFELLRRIKEENRGGDEERRWSVDPPVQLNLLPLTPVHRLDSTQLSLPWPTEDKIGNSESVSVEEAEERAAIPSSPAIRAVSSLHMNLAVNEKENDVGRKKLRLSKEQSTFLEESFKEQNTLNSKLKFVLAKQLDLRPRQIEVWFQNRRARTKLKQMEMDCEFLKRRCEALREENRRLHKEVTELRAIKTFNNQIMPPTTLFICPSCKRISPPTSPLQPPETPH